MFSLSISVSLHLSKRVYSLEEKCEIFKDEIDNTLQKLHSQNFDRLEDAINILLEAIKNDNNRTSQAILERLDSAKPIKPNNWDSMKEAFKGPVRDVNV